MIIDFTASIVTTNGIRARVESARADYGAECGGYFDYLLGKGEKTFGESACGFLLLDSLLGKHGIPRSELAISVDERGRPQILRDDLDFSVSHSEGCAMCAIAIGEGARIGCDIQRERDCSAEKLSELARTFMTDSELEGFARRGFQSAEFHLAWARRESYAKRVGVDVLDILKSVDLSAENFRTGIISAVGSRYYYAIC